MIIDGVNGCLIPMDDEIKFIEKPQRLFDNKKLRYRLGDEAKKIKNKNSFDKIGKKLVSDLQNLK